MQQHVYSKFSSLEKTHWWFVARRAFIRKVISYFFQNKQLEFCEIGCGTGGNLPMLTEFAQVDAVEMNSEARNIIMNKNNNPSLLSINEGHLPNNINLKKTYDGVFSLDVIEHVEDDLSALQSLKPLIKKDGYLILTVPAYQWLWSEHDVANHHYRRYTKAKFEKLIKTAGYEIEYSSYFNTLLFPLAVLSRLFENLFTSKSKPRENTLNMPSAFTNTIFKRIFSLESCWAGKLKMPFGLSIIVVAKIIKHN